MYKQKVSVNKLSERDFDWDQQFDEYNAQCQIADSSDYDKCEEMFNNLMFPYGKVFYSLFQCSIHAILFCVVLYLVLLYSMSGLKAILPPPRYPKGNLGATPIQGKVRSGVINTFNNSVF